MPSALFPALLWLFLPIASSRHLDNPTDPLPSSNTPRFILYRIYGNDLPPMQSFGQNAANLAFILASEAALPDCEKRWLVNRIVIQTERDKIMALFRQHGVSEKAVIERRLDWEEAADDGGEMVLLDVGVGEGHRHRGVPLEKHLRMFNHIVQLNQARNVVLQEGRELLEHSSGRWVLVFDGGLFVTLPMWNEIVKLADLAQQTEGGGYPFLHIPMYRLNEPQSPDWLNAQTDFVSVETRVTPNDNRGVYSSERFLEGSLAFHADTHSLFDVNKGYNDRSKMELIHEQSALQ
ncbi:unnamed protein product [Vitrella brassicaformis CCMP3155]|uniref:Uncharacterized protein n=1 Tax=Vitrella brassicaformis (strain CCMP3155) TaxID=1169540 RepID=A0A0G4GTL3_VITBC|nr:unnamed protein product [Vitrella brassicaformis CCMP3155]|eukprot:CEM34060.1 unnamed protein product [Vitrella brassicaformis CCMP3155]